MIDKRKRYVYRYLVQGTGNPLLRCPCCDWDLTQMDGGVTVLLYYGNGKSEAGLVEVASSLDQEGFLLDVDDQVATGYHSTTLCHDCGEQLWQCADQEQILV